MKHEKAMSLVASYQKALRSALKDISVNNFITMGQRLKSEKMMADLKLEGQIIEEDGELRIRALSQFIKESDLSFLMIKECIIEILDLGELLISEMEEFHKKGSDDEEYIFKILHNNYVSLVINSSEEALRGLNICISALDTYTNIFSDESISMLDVGVDIEIARRNQDYREGISFIETVRDQAEASINLVSGRLERLKKAS